MSLFLHIRLEYVILSRKEDPMFSLSHSMIKKILGNTIPSFQCTCKKTENLGFGYIFYGFTRAIRPKNVVVIGSKAGFAPILFALALKDNQGYGIKGIDCEETFMKGSSREVKLHFIDPSYSIEKSDKNHWYGLGKWDDPKKVKQLWKKYGVEKIIKHFKMKSCDYLKSKEAFDKIDLLYVDGDHSYAGIMHDFIKFYPKLSKDAIVMAHDVDPKLKEEYTKNDLLDYAGGFDAFNDVSDEKYEKFRLPIYPGLAIMRKRK